MYSCVETQSHRDTETPRHRDTRENWLSGVSFVSEESVQKQTKTLLYRLKLILRRCVAKADPDLLTLISAEQWGTGMVHLFTYFPKTVSTAKGLCNFTLHSFPWYLSFFLTLGKNFSHLPGKPYSSIPSQGFWVKIVSSFTLFLNWVYSTVNTSLAFNCNEIKGRRKNIWMPSPALFLDEN